MKKIIAILLLATNLSFGSKILTSNQVSYTLSKGVTKSTGIEVESVFDSYTDMFKQKISFDNLENKEQIFKDVDAVVTLTHSLDDDFLYEQARRYNIKVVNIDLTYSYRDNSSLVLSSKVDYMGRDLKYVWLEFSNIYKMIDILKEDLSELYPDKKDQIIQNSDKLKTEFLSIYESFMSNVLEKGLDLGVIQLGDSELDYLLDSLEIYHQNLPLNSSIDTIKKTMKETGINKVVSSKSISKDMQKKLTESGAYYTKLNIGNIPLDLDDNDIMDVDGYINILKENTKNLEELLKK